MRGEGSARRILCVFPRYSPSFGTFEYSYPLTDGRPRVHAAAGAPGHRRLLAGRLAGAIYRRKHAAGDRRRFRMGGGGVRQRHAYPAAADERHLPQRACVRSSGCARRSVGQRVPGLLSVVRLSSHRRTWRCDRSTDRAACARHLAARKPGGLQDQGARRDVEVSGPGLRIGRDPALLHRQRPVFERLPVSMRVLRHSRALRAQSAPEDAGAGGRRTRQAGRMRHRRCDLFRRRQFHRQPQGGARPAAAPGRVAEAQRLSHPPGLRGDAEHRQAAGNSDADARSLLRHRSSAASRRRIRMR